MLIPKVMCDGCKEEVSQQRLLAGFYRAPSGSIKCHSLSLEWIYLSELSNTSLRDEWPIHFHGFNCAMRFYGEKVGTDL
jgi:hypothetical protein